MSQHDARFAQHDPSLGKRDSLSLNYGANFRGVCTDEVKYGRVTNQEASNHKLKKNCELMLFGWLLQLVLSRVHATL